MAKGKQFTPEDDALLDELGVETKVAQAVKYTARQERIIAGFEEIQRFAQEHGRLPVHGEQRDIFERLYAVRLDRIRASDECMQLLKHFDGDGLLSGEANLSESTQEVELTDDELLDALGVSDGAGAGITDLKHVRPRAEIKAAEEVARREQCADFDQFQAMFEQVQRELDAGERKTAKFHKDTRLKKGSELDGELSFQVGDLFIVEGQKVVIAEMGEAFEKDFGRSDRKLRVVYDNGTESNLMLRSLERALYRGDTGRRILPADSEVPALFSGEVNEGDAETGTIYVLRSFSEHAVVAEARDVIHKIGVTKGDVEKRIANAKKDPTFLRAPVEVVAEYRVANLNPAKLENLLHKFFGNARLDMSFKDRFGDDVEPREWFLVPLPAIQDAIDRLVAGTLDQSRYDPGKAQILELNG